jgi:glycerol-3-phosphate acyltransferase PlsX
VDGVTVAVDAMGGDRAPAEVVAGAVEAAAEGVHVLLCGPQDAVGDQLAGHGSPAGVDVVDAPGVIDFHDEPAQAVRSRPDSSLVTACRLVREGKAGAALSAGSTGAMLAASLLVIGRIRGVHRPGIAVVLPGADGPNVLIDAGANAEGRAEHLLQFGVMGSIFAERVLGIERPAVGLLSIGEEATKGSPVTLEAHELLAAAPIAFAGNCEGRDALGSQFRVIVADGFAGNVLLKGLEGAGSTLFGQLRQAAASSTRAKLGGLLLRPALREVGRRYDPDTYGGAYLLGVRGLSVIAHGSSGRRAVRNAILLAARGVDGGVVGLVEDGLGRGASTTDLQDGPQTHTVPTVADPENGESQR